METVSRGATTHARAGRRALSGRALVRSVRCAGRGWAWAWRRQPNLRLETALGALALGLALWADAPLVPVLLCCGLVLGAELLNSALEALVDLASPDTHDLAGTAKDLAAGAVLASAVTAALVGVTVLGPAVWARLTGGA